MSMTLCVILSTVTIAIGILALRVGLRSGVLAAKVGGAMISVIGVLGLISCFLAE